MNKIYQKSFPVNKTSGFTLIELLVVVLIIGILAAVALPQYEKAVLKSRVSSILPWFKELKRGRDLYVLNGGTTACLHLGDFADAAGIGYTKFNLIETNRVLYCDSQLWVTPDLVFSTSGGGVRTSTFKEPRTNRGFYLKMILNPSTAKGYGVPEGTVLCFAEGDWAKQKCRDLTGAEAQQYGSEIYYRFPNY